MVPLDNSYIGIAVSIAGNVLISISLNTQKLAHKRLSEDYHRRRSDSVDSYRPGQDIYKTHRSKQASERTPLLNPPKKQQSRSSSKSHDLTVYAIEPAKNTDNGAACPLGDGDGDTGPVIIRELSRPADIIRDLAESSAELAVQQGSSGRIQRKWLQVSDRQRGDINPVPNGITRMDSHTSDSAASWRRGSYNKMTGKRSRKSADLGKSFYASKLWWLGLCLMALGELGNFTSYAFAPASVVAPLGTVALIANCFIAPLMLHERFRKKDILGIGFAIAGAVTIVLSSKSENKSLNPHQFIRAVSQPAFFIYAFISLGFIMAGDKYLAVDILICALCGGFTVLSVKAFSSFLTQDFVECFKQWPTYPVLAVLAVTAVMQIIFLNKALRRFESRVVVPTQFVSFTISAITGSAILYRDFEDVQLGKVVAFFFGCALVFLGVVFLTSSKHTNTDQHPANDTSQSMSSLEEDFTDSQITNPSIEAHSRLLDGVAISSHPPSTATTYNLSTSPNRAGRVLRKYNSIGMLPSRTGGASTALATPIRTARPPTLAPSKLFSPGYLLIAGSGFRDFGWDDGDDENRHGNLNEDLEAGLTHEDSASGSSEGSTEDVQRGGLETLLDAEAVGAERGREFIGDENEEQDQMTQSALMRRSGTI